MKRLLILLAVFITALTSAQGVKTLEVGEMDDFGSADLTLRMMVWDSVNFGIVKYKPLSDIKTLLGVFFDESADYTLSGDWVFDSDVAYNASVLFDDTVTFNSIVNIESATPTLTYINSTTSSNLNLNWSNSATGIFNLELPAYNGYLVTQITDGTTTVPANNLGVTDISSLLSGFDLTANYTPTGNWNHQGLFSVENSVSTESAIITLLANDYGLGYDLGASNVDGKFYVGRFANRYFEIDENNGTTIYNGLDVNSEKITNVADGTLSTDAVNKGQLDAAISGGFDTTSNYTVTGSWEFGAPVTITSTDGLDMDSNPIENVADAVNPLDAVNKSQLDAVSANTPTQQLFFVRHTDSTYTLLEADLLESKTHFFEAYRADGTTRVDTVTVSMPSIAYDNSQLVPSFFAQNGSAIKIIPLDGDADAEQRQYILPSDTVEYASITSIADDEWFPTNARWIVTDYVAPTAPATNLIINGTFDNANNLYLENSAWTVSGGVAYFDSTVTSRIGFETTQTLNTTAHTLTFEISNTSATSLQFELVYFDAGGNYISKGGFITYSPVSGNNYSIPFTPPANTGDVRIDLSGSTGVLDLDNVVITED